MDQDHTLVVLEDIVVCAVSFANRMVILEYEPIPRC
jgi:hypothetical protein